MIPMKDMAISTDKFPTLNKLPESTPARISFLIHLREKNNNGIPIKKWFLEQLDIQKKRGIPKKEAIKIVLAMEPFNQFPELISLMEE